ncbi:MAG TPA: chromate resistance protein ChrB domain-containing protein [Terriglobales bacterium]|nr:chromate resistance protein ChrB domain-containing protein [Terriglobales bacterium]
MSVSSTQKAATQKSARQKNAAWLLLVFTLPTAKASERVGIWRKLQRYGTLALPASGYVLPNNSMNQERFEWLATSIRSSKGQAAVAQVCSFDELRNEQIEQMFNEARRREYQLLEKELKKLAKLSNRDKPEAGMLRLKRRLQQIVEIDFFESPVRARIEEAVRQLESDDGAPRQREGKKSPKDYLGRSWITRPQPGIDRVSSAWLILRYIDPQAKFVFAKDPRLHPDAIPFDMFNAGGFGHVGNDCTFETLVKSFGIRDSRLTLVGQAIHDADFADENFGRTEALGIDRILDGWNKQGMANEEVLRRGVEMIEGLYNGIR